MAPCGSVYKPFREYGRIALLGPTSTGMPASCRVVHWLHAISDLISTASVTQLLRGVKVVFYYPSRALLQYVYYHRNLDRHQKVCYNVVMRILCLRELAQHPGMYVFSLQLEKVFIVNSFVYSRKTGAILSPTTSSKRRIVRAFGPTWLRLRKALETALKTVEEQAKSRDNLERDIDL